MATASFISLFNTKMTLGQEYRFKIYSYDSSHLHKLVIKCGSYSMTFDRVKGGVETTFTVPLTWGNAMPNSTSLNGTLTLTTYQSNYSTKVGSNDVQTTTFNIPSSMLPSVSLDVSEATSGIADKFGFYVQLKSKLKVVVRATGAYGSTIKSYKTTIEGVNYTKSSFTSNALTKSGAVTISTTITDSRGKTKSTSETIHVEDYYSPTIHEFQCNRCDDEGNLDEQGEFLNAYIFATIANLEVRNDCYYCLEYKAKSETEWKKLFSINNTYDYDEDYISDTPILDTEESYEVRLTITDFFTTRYAYFNVGTAFTLLDFNRNGKAIGFGKVSEKEEGVEFGMKAFFENGEAPNGAIDIPNSTDLDDVMDEGFYCIPTSSVSSSILNKPYSSTATGLLNVLRTGNEGQRVQIFMKCHKNTCEIYERHYYQEEWGDWVCVASGNKVLWSGGMYMTEGHTIALNESVSSQAKGIVLVFSRYVDGVVEDYQFNSFYIAKEFVKLHSGVGTQFNMVGGLFEQVATKYLYIKDNEITGHTNNDATGTSNGITYNNKAFVLRYVIGV